MEKVKFVSAKPYLSLPLNELGDVFMCVKGNKEVVVECSNSLKEELKHVSEYYIPRMKELINYLEKTGVEYEIDDLSNTSNI